MGNKICFASDNFAPVHPAVLQEIFKANEGWAPAYGGDLWTEKAKQTIQEVFQRSGVAIFFLPTGTGANVLGLTLSLKRHESLICTDIAHIQYQESGAAEAIVGCKLLTVSHQAGKITPEGIRQKIQRERAFGKHSTTPRVVSLTQPTEVGTVYTLEELEQIALLCKQEGLLLHMDGSRLYHAAVYLQAPLHEVTKFIDVLSLGGTKNGLMGAEALLVFNPALQEGSDPLQKQTLQLLSKMRYLSCQFIPLFKENLWYSLALSAQEKAKKIASCFKAIPSITLSYPVQTNQLFFQVPRSWIPLIQEKITCLLWDAERGEIRWITSWNTTEEEVEEACSFLKSLS